MSEFFITDTKNGFKTLSVINKENGKEIKLHSSYDPIKEAERSINAFDKGRSSIIIVSGVALAYHLNFLKKKYPAARIIALEKEKKILDITQKLYPESLQGIDLVNSADELGQIFENMDLADFKGIAHYIHKPSYQLNPEFYEDIITSIKLYISSRISDLLTRFEFEEKWIENIFRNLKHLQHSVNVSQLFGKFTGYPGVIVSAGPSLKKNINELEKIKDKAVIVAVDTAFKVLDKHNIKPHFVLTLDAQKYSFKHFTGVPADNTILVADIVSCPSILNTYRGRKIISTTSKYYQDAKGEIVRETTPMIDWVEKNSRPFGDVQSGGSVATSAFDLLLNMGCDPIILVGQDLAYSGREYHCSGTYHNDDWFPKTGRLNNFDTINQNIIRKRKIKYVTKYGKSGTVISDFIFDLYKSWFEDSAERVTVNVINSTGGGSKIKNTVEMDLQEAVKTAKKTGNPSLIIEKIMSAKSGEDISEIKKAIINGYNRLNSIIELTDSKNQEESIIDKINLLLDDDDTNELLKPLMRKSQFYVSRHAFEADKYKDIIYNDIRIAARKMKGFLVASGMIE
ncbi:MAG TPA: DUF115 domain-containing protein [Spirochaetota bacterium]|nr:DUF115 domain-containing protein [Spirochaetota bacterium]HPS87240.1 DUF115 domain-containing protein [Spirochaetota bacterium]